ncbi:dTDP-4-dehydrorhamnose 3,5-epimerase family protein [Paenibacillus pasadenensis]|uniref:dTDP-4-dehydrorhamnose 3,5-epimerase family protein n=1 Tax=Paenibacillus pasadenensis TaxID=217090 RepID=UPI00203FA776|nr:dTDP-4-dehydrorhamnose 3,5-epimerase family protein [Paenibacillus pasadenensis]MCM3750206.1 dTDP-4-dehydrorhamnose 3,5-epimerase family protein [Paenibacillus pasadenensis]
MIIKSVPLNNAAVIERKPIQDSRGYFARSFCKKTLAEYGIAFDVAQASVAFNQYQNTLRGMHFQRPPFCEDKIISCVSGAIYDVIIDLNKESSTYGECFGITLTEDNNLSLVVPKGFAHGYLTLQPNTSIEYLVSEYYTPSHESGIRWNDTAFLLEWPITDVSQLIISNKDKQWNDFDLDKNGLFLSGGNSHG